MSSTGIEASGTESETSSLAHIIDQFDKIGVYRKGMTLTLDQTFTGSAELTTMFLDCFSVDSLKINLLSWQKAANYDKLTLSATANLLNVENMGLNITAKELNKQLHFLIELTPPKTTSFKTCFPDLPLERTGLPIDETEGGMTPFLDKLSFASKKMVFTNQPCQYGPTQENLTYGLNFIGQLYFTGILYELSVLTGDEGPFTISGPLIEYRKTTTPLEFMGIRLTNSIDFDTKQFPIEIKNPHIHIKSPLYPGQTDHTIGFMRKAGVYLLADMDFYGQSWQMVGKLSTNNGEITLAFNGRMTNFTLSGLSSLTTNMDGMDIQKNLPPQLPTPSQIVLNEIGCSFNLSKKAIQSLTLGVGMDVQWPLIEDTLTLEEIGATIRVQSPFDKRSRKLSVTLSAALNVKNTMIVGFATLPTYEFGGGLPPGQSLPLGDLIETFGQGQFDLPALTINELFVIASPKNKYFAFECRIADALSIPVGDTAFTLNNIDIVMRYDKTEGLTGIFSSNMSLAGANAMLSAELDKQLTLTGSFYRVDLKTFWSQVNTGEPLPDEIPDIQFEYLTLSVTPKEGDFSLTGRAQVEWDKLPFEGSIATNVEFSFTVGKTESGGTKTTAINARLSLQGTGPADFADDFVMKSFNFIFEYATNQGWKLGGGTTVDIFDNELYLQAGYEDSQTMGKIFQLTTKATPEVKLISLQGIGHYSFSQLDLKINRKKIEGKKDQTYWNFRLDSTLAIDNVFTIAGFLSIFDQEDGRKGLLFNPDKGTAAAKIDFPGPDSGGVTISLFEAGITKESVESGWGFTGTVDVAFTKMPGWMDKLLPSKLNAKLVAGKNNVSISALRVTDVMPVELPKIDGEDMGTIYFQLTEVGIAIKPSTGLVLEAGIGFSQEVNNMLGGATVFRVYEKGNLLTLARTKFTINQSGISAQILTSPFAGANAVVINGESWFNVDFGDYGALRLKMPTFKYDGVTQYFEAGGGAEVTRPLAIPLKPIKMLLEDVKLKAAADALPNSLPIKSVDIVDNKGDFKVDELIKLLEGAGKMPSEIKDVLRETGDLLDRFPDTFKQYLNIVIPEKLEFKFGFSPTGRLTLGLKTGETPIRVLQAAMVQGIIPMPGLNGIELREISLGTIASGSLFQLTIDGHVDTYDFGTLALSLALPTDKSFPLPTSDELQRRLVLKNLFMIIPLQAGVPIPIPIFYDQVGLEYLGIEGVGLQGHIGFPQPELSGLPQFFSTLKQFFSDRKYLLDPKTPPGVDLQFNLGNNYLKTPEYMGSKVLGMKDKPVIVSVWSGLAHAMNFMKTISINELIQAIPIENRVGSADSSFAFLSFNADWLITTPKEFRDGAYQKMKLSDSDKEDFIAVLPTVASSSTAQSSGNEEGLIVFLRGEADLFIVKMEAVFGLAASGSMGFATGFKLTGTLAQIIEMEINGAVAINAPKVDESGSFSLPEAPALPANDVAELPVGIPLALTFDGSGTYVRVPDHGNLNFSGVFTVEVWVKFSAFIKTWQAVVTKGDDSWRLHRYQNTNKISFGTSGLSNGDLASSQTLKAGQWYHIAAVYTGKEKLLYINGELDNSVTAAGTLGTSNYPTMFGENAERPGRQFNGYISEVRLWNSAQSQEEIQENMYQKLSGQEESLVSCWRFESGYGTTAVDICGRNHGIMQTPAWTRSDLMKLDGLAFDGQSAFAEAANSKALQITGSQTIEMWLKPTEFGKRRNPLNKAYGGEGTITLEPDGKLTYYYGQAGGNAQPYMEFSSQSRLITHKWQHIAIIRDVRSKTLTWYIDGKKTAEGPAQFATANASSSNLTLGKGYAGFFSGEIDEVRIWKSARSASQIESNRLKRLTGNEAGLVVYWPFQRSFGSVAEDLAGANHVHLKGAQWHVPEEIENAACISGLSFNGSGTYIEIPYNDAFRASQYTVECWIKPEKPAAWAGIIGKPGRNFNIWLNTNGYIHHRFKVGGKWNAGAPNTANNSIKWNEWNHVAITNDGVTAKTYINGIQAASGLAGGAAAIDNTSLIIGRSLDGNMDSFYKGVLTEVRIWDRARSVQEIQDTMLKRLTGKETGLKGYWPMDEGGGAVVQDYASNIDAVVTQPVWTDRFHLSPAGVAFDGIDDYAEFPAMTMDFSQGLTISAWVFYNSMNKWSRIVDLGNGANSDNIVFANRSTSNDLIISIRRGTVEKNIVASNVLETGKWIHVAVAVEAGGKTVLYKNGEAVKTGVTHIPNTINRTINYIGRSNWANDSFFHGRIDELSIWTRACSADEIQGKMYIPLKGNEPGLAAYWSMNKGSGVQLIDRSGNGNVAVLHGPVWNIVSSPKQTETAAVQIFGHTHLAILGHRILVGDLRLIDDTFWFRGMLNLFPDNWPIKVYGDVEGLIKKGDFKVAGYVDTALAGLNLISAKFLSTNDLTRVEGTVFGSYLVLELFKKDGKSALKGSLTFSFNEDLHFGAITIAGAKVADGVDINVDIGFGFAIELSQSGFWANVKAKFEINGKGFDLSFTISIAPSQIEDVLEEIKKKIIDAPLDYLGDMFSDAAKWLEDIGKGAIKFIDNTGKEIGKALNQGFKVAETEVTGLLKNAGNSAEKIANALSSGYNKTAGDVAKLMKRGGMVAGEVGRGLKNAFNATTNGAAKALKDAGYAAKDVGNAIKGTFTNSVDDAAKALKDAGYAVNDVGNAIKGTFTNSVNNAAKALKNAGYAANDVGNAIKGTFTNSVNDAAKALKNAGYAANDVGNAIKGTFTNSVNDAAKALKDAGYAVEDVGNALKGTFTNSADAVGKALNSAGYAANEVGKVMKNTFGKSAKDVANFMKNTLKLGDSAVNSALKGAGYAASQVDNAMKDVFGWFQDVGKTLEKTFNPSKW
jgi:hypothetical protein